MDTLRNIGLSGPEVHLCTAFYSKKALEAVSKFFAAEQVLIAVRISLDAVELASWVAGYTDPEALLAFCDGLAVTGTKVSLFGHSEAHAKIYVGEHGALIGSSNLTGAGFGGGPEAVELLTDKAAIENVRLAASKYCAALNEIDLANLRSFVQKHASGINRKKAAQRQRGLLYDVDQVADIRPNGAPDRLGSYRDFLEWLDRQRSPAASTILGRGRGTDGKGLSGHVWRSFYGLRQYFFRHPEQLQRFTAEDPEKYRLPADRPQEVRIRDFVRSEATDEDDFTLDRWLTYLPIECGGRAQRHGGAIGTLSKMLPLLARYLISKH